MSFKPYYQDSAVTIYHGDCREIVPTLGRFDLLLTDPPYGIGYAGSMKLGQVKFGWKQYEGGWDENRPEQGVIESVMRSASSSCIWGGNFFPFLPVSAGWLVWNKVQRNFSMGEGEFAWTSFLNSVRIFDMARGAAMQDGKEHPTQKPVELMRWCIQKAGDTAKTILDPFAGSCTTGRAAKDLGRKCVCIEREEKYCEIGAKRMAQEVLSL
jgi:DNA modification methylase